MSEYNKTASLSPSVVQEAKQKRKKILDAARARRKIIYQRYAKKLQNQSPREFAV